jgi:TRAP-type C4-dicarboxylate transport system permease small subunit
MHSLLDKLDARGLSAARWFAFCGVVGMVAYALITIFDVFMRWAFNSPLDGVADANRLMVAIIIATFFPMAIAERHHVTIRFLGNALGPKVSAWLDLFGAALTLLFFVVLGWQLVRYTNDLFANQEATWLLGWPVGPWWATATAFMILCVPIQIVMFFVQARRARDPAAHRDDAAGRTPGH